MVVPEDVDKTANVRVTVDGEAVAPNKLAGEVFRSATEHEVVVSAPSRSDRHIKVANRQTVTITLGDPYQTTTAPPPPPAAEASSGGWGWQKWTGVSLVGAGLVGVTVSLIRVFSYVSNESRLADARNKIADTCVKNDAGALVGCPDRTSMSPRWEDFQSANAEYNDNERAARADAPLTVGLGAVGVLLIGGGIYLFATAPSASAEQASPPSTLRLRVVPQVGARDGSLSILGSF